MKKSIDILSDLAFYSSYDEFSFQSFKTTVISMKLLQLKLKSKEKDVNYKNSEKLRESLEEVINVTRQIPVKKESMKRFKAELTPKLDKFRINIDQFYLENL